MENGLLRIQGRSLAKTSHNIVQGFTQKALGPKSRTGLGSKPVCVILYTSSQHMSAAFMKGIGACVNELPFLSFYGRSNFRFLVQVKAFLARRHWKLRICLYTSSQPSEVMIV